MCIELTDSDTLLGILLGVGLSAAAGLRVFVPLLVLGAASLSGHVELSSGWDWIGTWPAVVGFGVAAVVEVCAYLVPFLDNLLDAVAGPAAAIAGAVLMASSVVDVDPFLQWTLAIVAGGGLAGTVHLFTGAVRLTSTATTAGAANPAVATAEAGGSAGVSLLAIAAPVLGALAALALLFVAVRTLTSRARPRSRPRPRPGSRS